MPLDEREETQAHEARFHARIERVGSGLGLAKISTHRDSFDYLLRTGLIEKCEERGLLFYRTTKPLPLPVERLALSKEEIEEEDAFRWREHHERNAQKLIGLFVERPGTAPAQAPYGRGRQRNHNAI